MTPVARPRADHLAAWPCPAALTGLDADVCHLCQRLAQLIDPQEFAFVCEHERQPARQPQGAGGRARGRVSPRAASA